MKADNPLTMGRRKKNGNRQLRLLELPGIARYSKGLFNGMANPARVEKAALATMLQNKVAPRWCYVYQRTICIMFNVLVFLLKNK